MVWLDACVSCFIIFLSANFVHEETLIGCVLFHYKNMGSRLKKNGEEPMELSDRSTFVTRLIDHYVVRDQGRWLQLQKGSRIQTPSHRDTRSRWSASALITLQLMTVEQQGRTIVGLWSCHLTADAGKIKETLFLTVKILGVFIFGKIKIA